MPRLRRVYLPNMDTQCSQPIPIRNGRSTRLVRCRKCPPCCRAAQRYWAAAAANQIRTADLAGCRSWFGTCTFNPETQKLLLARASERSADSLPLKPPEKVKLLHDEVLHEVQKYWKRLRRQGLSLRYLATFEDDRSAKPHIHCLVHETDSARPIRKRELDESWGLGFTNFRLLKLTADGDLPYGVISYVTKSLASQRDFRLCASLDYRPERQLPKGQRPRQLALELGQKV